MCHMYCHSGVCIWAMHMRLYTRGDRYTVLKCVESFTLFTKSLLFPHVNVSDAHVLDCSCYRLALCACGCLL